MVVLANLKPRNMCGVKSFGMLMAASDAAHENVELLVPPEGAVPGDRVWFGSIDEKDNLPEAASPNQASLLSISLFFQLFAVVRSYELCEMEIDTKIYEKQNVIDAWISMLAWKTILLMHFD